MSIGLILGLIALAVGLVGTTLNITQPRNSYLAFLCGMIALTGTGLVAGSAVEGNNRVNNIYAAAAQQNITVTTSPWRQAPRAVEPCSVKLRFDEDKKVLLLSGADVVATPEVLEAICSK